MKILDIYIIKKFLGTFFYAISLLILVVIVVDISENIDEFLDNNAPLDEIIINYYINFIPYFINLFSFLFTFISVIFFTSKMASNTEIVAILSSGVSFYRMLRPYMISAIFLGLMSFYLSNFLIPKTNIKRRVFKDRYMEELTRGKERNIHLQISPGEFIYLENYNLNSGYGYKFTLEKVKEQKLRYKLTADRIQWDSINGSWKMYHYFVRNFTDTTESIVTGRLLDTTIKLKPADLIVLKEDFEEMNYWQLRKKIADEKLKGSDEVKVYEMEKHNRIAGPFATIILTLIGVALSSRKVRGGIGMHLGLGIALTFTFIMFMKISNVFAVNGHLSPFLAAWIPNLVFGIIAAILIRLAPK